MLHHTGTAMFCRAAPRSGLFFLLHRAIYILYQGYTLQNYFLVTFFSPDAIVAALLRYRADNSICRILCEDILYACTYGIGELVEAGELREDAAGRSEEAGQQRQVDVEALGLHNSSAV